LLSAGYQHIGLWETLVNYINNQEKHYAKSSFRDEYLEMLKKNEVAFKPEYLFDFFDDID
jgi:hypothetical protein